jgi:hypothetical protein
MGVVRHGQAPQEGLHGVDDQQRLGIAAMLGPSLDLQCPESFACGLIDSTPYG